MSIYAFKPRFQALLRPLTTALARAGFTANAATLIAAAGSLIVGGVVIGAADAGNRLAFLLLPVWFLVRMALNAIDGILAREFGQKSRLGAYLNELCDVVSDAALILPFALIAPFDLGGISLVVFLAALTEFAGVLGLMIGVSRRYDGPMGKSDRALVFGVLALWIGIGGPMPNWLGWLIALINLLLIATVVNRVRAGLREAAGRSD